MSKKELLNETQIRRFMKLANLEPLTKNILSEMHDAPPADTTRRPETGMQEEESSLSMEAEMPEMEDEGGGDDDLMDFIQKLKKVMKPDLADKLEVEAGEEEEGAEEEEEAPEMDLGGEEGEEESDEGEGEEEEMDEAKMPEKQEKGKELSEDALVEAVLSRVTARLVAEAKKAKAKKKGLAGKMADKKAAKKSADKEEKVMEEALDGVNLAEKGKDRGNVWKGHADMTMAKGDKGGKGGHEMETMTAKAEHTVTHGGKNLATMGGNKKKV